MLLLNIFDRAHRMHPTATLSLYVDDGTIEAMGPAAMVTETLVGATNCICDGMDGVGLTVSRTKNVVVASSQELGKAIEEGTRGWKVRFVRATKMLGTGAAAGIRRAGGVTLARVTAFLRRQGNYGALRRAGGDVAKVLATGGHSVATYGIA